MQLITHLQAPPPGSAAHAALCRVRRPQPQRVGAALGSGRGNAATNAAFTHRAVIITTVSTAAAAPACVCSGAGVGRLLTGQLQPQERVRIVDLQQKL